MEKIKGPIVRIGQVWEPMDRRYRDRQFRIIGVESHTDAFDHHLVFQVLTENLRSGRTTRINIDRLRPVSGGYRLVRDAPPMPGFIEGSSLDIQRSTGSGKSHLRMEATS
jgi:hypothetical protein